MRLFIAVAGLMCASVLAQSPSAVPVDIQIPISPTPFASKGKLHYVYEIHLTNLDRRGRALTLSRVEVLSDQGKPLATFGAGDLIKQLMQPGLAEGSPDLGRLGAGRRAVLFAWVSVGEGEPRPASLQHRFVIAIEGVAGDNTVECCQTAIPREGPLVIGQPLRGGGWLAGNGPSESSEHRRALLTVDGRVYLAQRFAIDWIQFGKNGELGSGRGTENRDYFGYGAEVLAVASGRVCGIKDGIPENKPESLAVPITLETIAGNYVCLDLGGGRYAHYAHLQPGSMRVKLGDRVEPGQVLALLGNSGNSDAPHLHFQITDGPSVLASEGMPYLLPSFVEEGKGEDFKFKPASAPTPWRNQLPVDGMVVRFPQ
ncbi:MAG TPA: M23 family metallopeptidase [Bryobacteraceae bacterium]|nr:M23 family metallopeptidase [Bryobacteraceae bacterium]